MTLTTPQRKLFAEIQKSITKNGGRTGMSIWWNQRTVAALQKKELLEVHGDEITLHANRWRFDVGEYDTVPFKIGDKITPIQTGGTNWIFTVTGCGLHLVSFTDGRLKMRERAAAMRLATSDELNAATAPRS